MTQHFKPGQLVLLALVLAVAAALAVGAMSSRPVIGPHLGGPSGDVYYKGFMESKPVRMKDFYKKSHAAL